MKPLIRRFMLGMFVAAAFAFAVSAAVAAEPAQPVDPPGDAESLNIRDEVAVQPTATDADIAARLLRILEASGWFVEPQVRVEEGIVFLAGHAGSDEHKDWAARLARNTQDVLAVVNRIEVDERSVWDFTPTWARLREHVADAVRKVPILMIGLVLLTLTWAVASLAVRGARTLLRPRIRSPLLTEVVARASALPVFLLGLYTVLNVLGLTGLALSVIGGTGLAGLIIGFAFRDIAENFLASLLISMQRPFATGDRIAVAGYTGVVQRVNPRATLLMTLDGNHVQIPNATIYKQPITNYTANPLERFDFTVGIGYEDSVTNAQSVAQQVLRDHPAVLDDPETMVLVTQLGPATVTLCVHFWIDNAAHSGPKVRSSVMRLIKRAFEQAGISMPDEAREVVFPRGVPVQMLAMDATPPVPQPGPAAEDEFKAHGAEGHFSSETPNVEQQARRARLPEGGQNLLDS